MAVSGQASSLDRYLWERSQALVGGSYGGAGALIGLKVNFFVQTALGLVFASIGFANPGSPIFWPFALVGTGWMAVGIGLGVAAKSLAKRIRNQIADVRATPEAMQLIVRLCQHIGWQQPSAQTIPVWNQALWGSRSAVHILPAEIAERLEAAAERANRALALTGRQPAHQSATLRRLSPEILEGIDEAMVVCFNAAARILLTPESSESHLRQMDVQIVLLEELAERMESLAGQQPTLADSLASQSTIRDVLEQLRTEDEARKDLAQSQPTGPGA